MKYTRMLYKPVVVEFRDHAKFDRTVECRAIGWLCREDKEEIILCYWDCKENEDRYENNEYLSIVKAAISKMTLLK